MVRYERTEKGYCYKIDKNGKKQRISKSEYQKKSGGNINTEAIRTNANLFHSNIKNNMQRQKAMSYEDYIRKRKEDIAMQRQRAHMNRNSSIHGLQM